MIGDFKLALRVMMKSPVFSAIAVVTLALGIGANAAIFSVVENTLLRPLPFRQADRLVRLYESNDEVGARTDALNLSPQAVRQWREYGRNIFEDVGAADGITVTVGGVGIEPPRNVQAAPITANFFSVLGVTPARGRAFTSDEDRENGPPVAIISDDFWRDQLGGRSDVIGSTLSLSGLPHTIVGVMPKGFRHPYRSQIWLPARLKTEPTSGPLTRYLYGVARLKPGIRASQAQEAMRGICMAINRAEPNPNNSRGIYMPPLHESFVMDVRTKLLLIVVAAACALFIAATNFAGLLLTRVIEREGEFAVRMALGATRVRLVKQQLIQAVLLAGIGTLTGLLIAFWVTPTLFKLSPEGSDRTAGPMRDFGYAVTIDWRVFLFASGVMALVGLGFGLLPAIRAARPDLRGGLSSMARGATLDRGARQLLNSFVVGELAIAAMLLMASITATQYFRALVEEPWGFETDNRLAFSETLSDQLYPTGEDKEKVLEATLTQLRALPAVISATVTSPALINAPRDLMAFNAEGAPPAPEPAGYYITYVRAAPSGYFKAMGQPLLRGREFLPSDKANAPLVCIVSDAFARRFWPNQDPIGKRVKWGRLDGPRPWMTVVGVVSDMKAIADPAFTNVIGMVARPLAQMTPLGSVLLDDITFVIHSSGKGPSEAAIRSTLARVDSRIAPSNFLSLEEAASQSRAIERFIFVLVSLFSVLGLLLATVGLYGLLSLHVARRQREFGIRSALGATGGRIVELIMQQGATLSCVGFGVGTVATVAIVSILRRQWTQMPSPNLSAWIGSCVVLSLVVLLAAWLPGRRASRIDPVVALRSE
ncbi:MAG: hypothetical protein DME45_02910 [Verrucomicrobia bacterium]|nr:MAG: hypothetical protein DME45_02910 [Verrucomicrobiota bacterium]